MLLRSGAACPRQSRLPREETRMRRGGCVNIRPGSSTASRCRTRLHGQDNRMPEQNVMSRPRRRLLMLAAAASLVAAFTAAPAAHAAGPHVANPFVGATQYLSPDYTAEVNAQATADGGALGAAEASVANFPTAVWMDRIAAIAGDSVHHGL